MAPVLVEPAAPRDIERVRALELAARAVHGHAVLGDAVWRDLAAPTPDSAGFFATVDGGHAGYAHIARSDNFSQPHWAVALVRQPRIGADPTGPLLDAVILHAERHGGGRLVLWQFDPTPDDDVAATDARFAIDRELFQMQVTLPLVGDAAGARRLPDGVSIRAFRPGGDEQAWLAVNNRAFANHPDQGGWIAATLERRMAESWFDPSLFLLAVRHTHPDDPALLGFNWLKVHPPADGQPAIGEIFVIGVDPDAQGLGLGRTLAVEGLRRVAARGITVGMLYVAAENAAAVALYRSLGFSVTRIDRAYVREV